MERICKHYGLYFGNIKQEHDSWVRSKKSVTFIDDQQKPINLIRTQRIAARRQRELLLNVASQEFEWQAKEEADY